MTYRLYPPKSDLDTRRAFDRLYDLLPKPNGNGGSGLTDAQLQLLLDQAREAGRAEATQLLGAFGQPLVGDVSSADPLVTPITQGGTVTSINGAGGTNISVTGGPITGSGTLTISISATPTFTTVNATTQYNVAGTKVLGAQGAAVADVASADATDLPTVITLANEIKAQFNTWLARARAATGHGLIS
jgi:hypothetical protein